MEAYQIEKDGDEDMPLSVKGKKMLNILVKEYGKKKARHIFYAMEHNRPEWVSKWRRKQE